MTQERASKRQQELLSFVDRFIKDNGYGPSYREVMRALGYKSVSTVAIHVEALIAKGYLVRRDKSARSLEVVSLRPSDVSNAPAPSIEIEQELTERLKRADLSDEQREAVVAALRLIGIAVASEEKKGDDETT